MNLSLRIALIMPQNCSKIHIIIIITTYHEQLQQQHQQKQQGLLLLLVERILLAPLEFEFNGPSLPGAIAVGEPKVPPTADIFEKEFVFVCDGFCILSLPPILLLRPLS